MAVHPTRRHAIASLGCVLAAPAFAQRRGELEVPYVPTPHELVETMLDLAALTPSDYLIDLGCGDGRIAIAAAKRGARALGVDLDPLRLQVAHNEARRAAVQGRVSFRRQDLFATPIHEASVVALYLLPAINLRLRPRLLTELPAGARIVSHAFDMGEWEADEVRELDSRRVFLWHVPAVAGGSWDVTGADGRPWLLEVEQSFQKLTATLSGGGETIALTGRMLGLELFLTGPHRTTNAVLKGRIDGPTMIAVEGSSWAGGPGTGWRAVRNG